MSVDVPRGGRLNIARVHRRWGMVDIPEPGRVRFRWTKDLPVGKRADADDRLTDPRLERAQGVVMDEFNSQLQPSFFGYGQQP